jgi:hypothetical protein
MHLNLYIPGLLLPAAILADTAFDLQAPTLSLLLGRGHRHTLSSDWLADQFGLAASLPAAALRNAEPGKHHWLCLDPVHLDISREGIAIADPALLKLTEAESAALLDLLRPLFAPLGELGASAPGRWEIRLTRPLELDTLPLPDAIDRPVDPGLPGGADGRTLRHLIAEAQTLLHAHPVNRQREALNRPIISSLWPWGPGALPETIQTGLDVVWSADPVIAGLCAHAGRPCLMPPGGFQHASGRVLVTLDTLAQPARSHNALGWRAALLALESDWLAPALAALKAGTCTSLQLVGTCLHESPATTGFTLQRGDLWKIWKRPRPLTALA